eukprot:scaffold132316_cov27-Tisochrysis_lutea.AAC.8
MEAAIAPLGPSLCIEALTAHDHKRCHNLSASSAEHKMPVMQQVAFTHSRRAGSALRRTARARSATNTVALSCISAHEGSCIEGRPSDVVTWVTAKRNDTKITQTSPRMSMQS